MPGPDKPTSTDPSSVLQNNIVYPVQQNNSNPNQSASATFNPTLTKHISSFRGIHYTSKKDLNGIISNLVRESKNDVPAKVVVSCMRDFIMWVNITSDAYPESRVQREPRYVTRLLVDRYFSEVIKIRCYGQNTDTVGRHASSIQLLYKYLEHDYALDYDEINPSGFIVRNSFVNECIKYASKGKKVPKVGIVSSDPHSNLKSNTLNGKDFLKL